MSGQDESRHEEISFGGAKINRFRVFQPVESAPHDSRCVLRVHIYGVTASIKICHQCTWTRTGTGILVPKVSQGFPIPRLVVSHAFLRTLDLIIHHVNPKQDDLLAAQPEVIS